MAFKDLKFVELAIEKPEDINSTMMLFNMIPDELFEQVKDRDFDIYRMKQMAQGLLSNKAGMFHILVDKENEIKGILWGYANILCNCIEIVLFTVDKEYQFDNALEHALKFIKSWQRGAQIKITTTRTKAYEKMGFVRSKDITMELNHEDN